MKCPRCASDVPVSVRFCGSCGAPMTMTCNVCGEPSPHGTKFCQNCGAELSTALSGIPLTRALAWRDTFESIGWVDDPSKKLLSSFDEMGEKRGKAFANLMINGLNIPNPIKSNEPWLFLCHVQPKDWKIADITLNGKHAVLSAGDERLPHQLFTSGFRKELFIVATRCRLVLVEMVPLRLDEALNSGSTTIEGISAHYWLYEDIIEAAVQPSGSVTLLTRKGETIGLNVKTRGARFIDVAYAMGHAATGGGHEGEYVVAQANRAMAEKVRRDFMSVISEFCKEVVRVGEMTGSAT